MRHDAHALTATDPLALHAQIERGLPLSLLDKLAGALGLKVETMAALCGMSRATFHRKKAAKGKLGEFESDRAARYAALVRHATDVFADEKAAADWLCSEQVGLGGARPIDLARTTQGYQEVEKLLTRIDHSVYA